MAASLSKVLLIAGVISVVIKMALAVDYTVGAPGGWDLRTNLSAWASPISFKIGDNLEFVYDRSQHDVVEVSKSNYDACNVSQPIKTYNSASGKDVIPLSSPGDRYFVCGFPNHCANGMKLQINTAATSPASPAPENGVPGGPPSPSSAGRRSLEGKVAAVGVVAVGVMMVFAL